MYPASAFTKLFTSKWAMGKNKTLVTTDTNWSNPPTWMELHNNLTPSNDDGHSSQSLDILENVIWHILNLSLDCGVPGYITHKSEIISRVAE